METAAQPNPTPKYPGRTAPTRKRRSAGTDQAAALAVTNMVQRGISPGKAAELLGLNQATGYRIMARQTTDGQVSGLLTAQRDDKLAALVDTYLDAGRKKKPKEIKASDALGAAKLYADRRYPTRSDGAGDTNISFLTVNLGQYGLRSAPEAALLDITPAEPIPTPYVLGDGI